jgi:hypothetical protein
MKSLTPLQYVPSFRKINMQILVRLLALCKPFIPNIRHMQANSAAFPNPIRLIAEINRELLFNSRNQCEVWRFHKRCRDCQRRKEKCANKQEFGDDDDEDDDDDDDGGLCSETICTRCKRGGTRLVFRIEIDPDPNTIKCELYVPVMSRLYPFWMTRRSHDDIAVHHDRLDGSREGTLEGTLESTLEGGPRVETRVVLVSLVTRVPERRLRRSVLRLPIGLLVPPEM